MKSRSRTAVIGGTGNLGAALARRLALAGWPVLIGSRSVDKAQAFAAELGANAQGSSNVAAAGQADIVILAVPFSAQQATIEEILPALRGQILVDTTVPLVPPRVARVQMPPEGSAAERARGLIGERAHVVSAFHNVAAHKLATGEELDCDILVFGDEKEARDAVVALVEAIGLRGLHGGPLANSAAAEALTSVLIFLNKAYGAGGAGIRITGLPSVSERG